MLKYLLSIHFMEQFFNCLLALSSGLQVGGREAKVDLSEPRAERPKLERTPQENSVFIGNLDFAVQEEQLIEMCSDLVGPDTVMRVRLAADRDTGTTIAIIIYCNTYYS